MAVGPPPPPPSAATMPPKEPDANALGEEVFVMARRLIAIAGEIQRLKEAKP